MKNKNVKSALLLATMAALVFGVNFVTGCAKHSDSETNCFNQGFAAGVFFLDPNNPNFQQFPLQPFNGSGDCRKQFNQGFAAAIAAGAP